MYREKKGDLFQDVIPGHSKPTGVFYVQCISADKAMGAGIALEFNRMFNTKISLIKKLKEDERDIKIGDCEFVSPVFNIVTKNLYWQKPTISEFKLGLTNLLSSIEDYKIIQKNNEDSEKIREIRMPMIGCGIDKLKWSNVRKELQNLGADLELLGIDLTVIDLKLPDMVGDKDGKTKEEKR